MPPKGKAKASQPASSPAGKATRTRKAKTDTTYKDQESNVHTSPEPSPEPILSSRVRRRVQDPSYRNQEPEEPQSPSPIRGRMPAGSRATSKSTSKVKNVATPKGKRGAQLESAAMTKSTTKAKSVARPSSIAVTATFPLPPPIPPTPTPTKPRSSSAMRTRSQSRPRPKSRSPSKTIRFHATVEDVSPTDSEQGLTVSNAQEPKSNNESQQTEVVAKEPAASTASVSASPRKRKAQEDKKDTLAVMQDAKFQKRSKQVEAVAEEPAASTAPVSASPLKRKAQEDTLVVTQDAKKPKANLPNLSPAEYAARMLAPEESLSPAHHHSHRRRGHIIIPDPSRSKARSTSTNARNETLAHLAIPVPSGSARSQLQRGTSTDVAPSSPNHTHSLASASSTKARIGNDSPPNDFSDPVQRTPDQLASKPRSRCSRPYVLPKSPFPPRPTKDSGSPIEFPNWHHAQEGLHFSPLRSPSETGCNALDQLYVARRPRVHHESAPRPVRSAVDLRPWARECGHASECGHAIEHRSAVGKETSDRSVPATRVVGIPDSAPESSDKVPTPREQRLRELMALPPSDESPTSRAQRGWKLIKSRTSGSRPGDEEMPNSREQSIQLLLGLRIGGLDSRVETLLPPREQRARRVLEVLDSESVSSDDMPLPRGRPARRPRAREASRTLVGRLQDTVVGTYWAVFGQE